MSKLVSRYAVPILVVVWLPWLISGIWVSRNESAYNFSVWSSVASALSFAVLLPLLFVQMQWGRETLKVMDENVKSHLKELRRVSSTEESLKTLLDWMNDSNTLALLYVSRLSAIPAFWIRGYSAVTNHLNAADYGNGGKRKVHFVGPAAGTASFNTIAELALTIAGDDARRSALPDGTKTRFEFLRESSVDDIERDYVTSKGVLEGKGIEIYLLADEQLSKLSVNFVLRRIPPEFSPVNSPWQVMFFDDANILNGQSIESLAEQIFYDPAIYMSENPALGYMFRYIANEATGQRFTVGET